MIGIQENEIHDPARMGVTSASSSQKKRLLSVCNKIGKILGEPQFVPTRSHLSRYET